MAKHHLINTYARERNGSPLVVVALSFVAGMAAALATGGHTGMLPWLTAVVGGCMLAGRWPRVQSVLLLLGVAMLGWVLASLRLTEAERPADGGEARPLRLVVASEVVERVTWVSFDAVHTATGRRVKCLATGDDRSRRLAPGDGLQAVGRIEPVADYGDSRFSYSRYLAVHGFEGQCRLRTGQWSPCPKARHELSFSGRARVAFLRYRHRLLARLQLHAGTDPASYGVVAAMALGDKSALSRNVRQTYAHTGAAHILALSGMHLGILYFLLSHTVLGRGRRRVWQQALLVAAVWSFVCLAGLPGSLVRAATMLTIVSLGRLGGRNGASVGALALAAIVILAADPLALFDVGFQLSFLAVLSIVLFMPLAEQWVGPAWMQRHHLAGALLRMAGVSVAAQAGTAPLVAYYFGQLPTYFLLTNLVVLPAAVVVLYGSLLVLLVPWAPLSGLLWQVVAGLNRVLAVLGGLPFASITGLSPRPFQVVLAYVLLALLYAFFRRLPRPVAAGATA